VLFRTILWLVGAVLAISALRSIIGMIAKVFSDFAVPSKPAGSGQQTRKPAVPISESLKQDPVCGTFIAPSTALQKTIGGTTYYFCSAQCRDKFKAA